MPIILQESLRGLFYAPFYACFALGAFESEGVEVEFVSAPSPGAAPDGLFAGTVDVSWGGPMRVNQLYEARPDCDLVCIGEAVTRDPFFLVGREPCPDFAFADLYRRRVATVSEVPTPWLCLQHDLRRAGLDPDQLAASPTARWPTMPPLCEAASSMSCKYSNPLSRSWSPPARVTSGTPRQTRGPTSYTAFYTRRAVLAAKRDEFKRLVRALYRTQKWLHANPPEALAEAAQSYFPGSCATADARCGGALPHARHLGRIIRSCRAAVMSGCERAWFPADLSEKGLRSNRPSTTASPKMP